MSKQAEDIRCTFNDVGAGAVDPDDTGLSQKFIILRRDDATGEDQDLGNWNMESNTVGRTGLNGGFNVHNSDFRKWRAANQKGGDFLVYSDLRVLRQTSNNTFVFRR